MAWPLWDNEIRFGVLGHIEVEGCLTMVPAKNWNINTLLPGSTKFLWLQLQELYSNFSSRNPIHFYSAKEMVHWHFNNHCRLNIPLPLLYLLFINPCSWVQYHVVVRVIHFPLCSNFYMKLNYDSHLFILSVDSSSLYLDSYIESPDTIFINVIFMSWVQIAASQIPS